MKDQYQLVYPYHSDNIYEASSLNSGSSKCYRELQMSKYKNLTDKFSVMNVVTMKIYSFEIHKNNINYGGFNETLDDNGEKKEEESLKKEEKDPSENLASLFDNGGESVKINVGDDKSKMDSILEKISVLDKKMDKILNINARNDKDIYQKSLQRLENAKILQSKTKTSDIIEDNDNNECSIM